jgi:hypothetical protein
MASHLDLVDAVLRRIDNLVQRLEHQPLPKLDTFGRELAARPSLELLRCTPSLPLFGRIEPRVLRLVPPMTAAVWVGTFP